MPAIASQRISAGAIAAIQIASNNLPDQQQPYNFPSAGVTYTWSPPQSGRWKFVGWGPGDRGASGAYFEVTRFLRATDSVTIQVGRTASSDTVLTLPGGLVATAGRASSNTAGVASGGDVNLNGTDGPSIAGASGGAGLGTGGGSGGLGDGSTYAGGSGAPANLPFRGANGGDNNLTSPGPGAGAGQPSAGTIYGGNGYVLAVRLGD
jgi:hypothetical protein